MDKTTPNFGNYRLLPAPSATFPRAVEFARSDAYINFFFKHSFERKLSSEFAYIPFPIDLGIVGFRVCFASSQAQEKLLNIETLDQLRALSHIQGNGWSDVEILRFNGFKVQEVGNYESMFHMVARDRTDLFCRGANELYDEYQARNLIPKLAYDSSMAIVYPLPRFFFTNAKNVEAIERVKTGLLLAYEDGSLVELWEQYYGESYSFSALDSRKIFKINNPMLKGLDPNYEKYFYGPLKQILSKE